MQDVLNLLEKFCLPSIQDYVTDTTPHPFCHSKFQVKSQIRKFLFIIPNV